MTKFKLDARWAIVAVGFVALSLAFSGRSMLSLAMDEWAREFGWTKAAISTVMTVTLVAMAGLAPLVGYAIDRSGPRVILTGGLLMVGASSAVLAGMDSMLAFIIGFAVLGALGFGLVATHAVSSAVARSFDVGQGRAVGIATSGSTAGQFVFMPILGLVLACRASSIRNGFQPIPMVVKYLSYQARSSFLPWNRSSCSPRSMIS